MYLIIEHCNGEIMADPIITLDKDKLEEYINGEYLIYSLCEGYLRNGIIYLDRITP